MKRRWYGEGNIPILPDKMEDWVDYPFDPIIETERKTFSLLCMDGDPETARFEEVDGEWIEVITGIDTFIWSDQDEDIYGLHGPFDVFHVVEGRSGICIGRGFYEEEAIDSAKALRRFCGRDCLQNVIERTIQRFGLSPAFR